MEFLYEPYWDSNCKRPWIGRIIEWKVGKKPELEWGELSGHEGSYCSLSVEAEPGDIIRYGITHMYKYNRSVNVWAVVNDEGELELITPPKARKLWREKENALLESKDTQSIA